MLLWLFWLFGQPANLQPSLPQFDQFSVNETFSGKPAPPILATKRDRTYRTMIREGASKGPDFAGHFTIALWGCGAGCVTGALVDAKTGKVSDLPFSVLSFAEALKFPDGSDTNSGDFEPLVYQRHSRLLVVRGCPEEKNCAAYYYEWTPGEFHLLRKIAPAAH
jgi:hypothetical protein